MKKNILLSMLLVILLAAGSLNGFAKSKEKDRLPPTNLNLEFGIDQTFTRDGIVYSGGVCTIKPGVTVTLEKDYVWIVYGDLVVDGTLVNKGTIKINQSQQGSQNRGHLENKGHAENEGLILVNNAKFRNNPGAVLDNPGIIKLVGDQEKQTLMQNAKPLPSDGNRKAGIINNSGIIVIANTKGTGFSNEGSINNTGTIKADPGASYPGVTLGEPAKEQPSTPESASQPASQPPATAPGTAPSAPAAPTSPGGGSTTTQPNDPEAGKKALDRFVKGGKSK